MKYLKVTNKSKQRVLGWRVELADSFWARLKGLLGRPDLPIGTGLVLRPCNSIHSLLMRFQFDAIFLDRDNRVLLIAEEIKPGQIIKPVPRAIQVIELPAGAVKSTKTEVGDELILT